MLNQNSILNLIELKKKEKTSNFTDWMKNMYLFKRKQPRFQYWTHHLVTVYLKIYVN